MKPYDVGLVCGRFQTFHKGHEKLIDTGLLLCDRMLILVGSAQECGTERNPLNVNTRIKMIREVYGDDPNIMIYALSDLTDENDITPDWGRYLLQNVDRYIYKNPDVMIFDEATSNLDVATSNLLKQSIHSIFAEKMCIIITHDQEMAAIADKVLRLSE